MFRHVLSNRTTIPYLDVYLNSSTIPTCYSTTLVLSTPFRRFFATEKKKRRSGPGLVVMADYEHVRKHGKPSPQINTETPTATPMSTTSLSKRQVLLSNLPLLMSPEEIARWIIPIAKVEKLLTSRTTDGRRALVQFESVEDAVLAMGKMHGTKIEDQEVVASPVRGRMIDKQDVDDLDRNPVEAEDVEKSVRVENLPRDVLRTQVRRWAEDVGEVQSVALSKVRKLGEDGLAAVVEFCGGDAVDKAVVELSRSKTFGRKVQVSRMQTK